MPTGALSFTLIFSHPDYTVGMGISPIRHHKVLADCHRRCGISPRPKDIILKGHLPQTKF